MDIRFWSFKSNRNSKENENKNATGEDTYAGALRAPRAGSPACVFVFVFDLIYAEFEFQISDSTSDSTLDSTSDSTLDSTLDFVVVVDFGLHARTINKINTAKWIL